MPETEDDIERLWTAVFGGPPPVRAPPELLLELLVNHLPAAPPYQAERED